jgi:transcription antitermination factor NusG
VSEREDIYRCSFPWFALRLRSNFEKTTAQLLEYRGYEVFLPTYRTRRRWSDRVKEIDAPFFAGYLFCRIDISHRLPVLTTPGVVGIAGRGRIPEPVDDHEIAAVQAIVKSGLFSQPWPFLTAGDRIRVECGPLAGTEGILTCTKGDYRLVASISLLQRSVAVELDRDWVQPVDHNFRPAPALASRVTPPRLFATAQRS